MRINLLHLTIGLLAGALLAGCGTSQPKSRTEKFLAAEDGNVDLVESVTGIDDGTTVDIEDDEESEQSLTPTNDQVQDEDLIGGSQGAFVGRLMLDGKESEGTFTVKAATQSGDVIMENIAAGSEIKLDPGSYDFIFQTEAVVGKPEFTLRDVEIPAGRRIKRDVKMPVGKITLVTGGRCAKRPIKIKLQGATEWIKGKFHTCVQMTLLAGTYDAEMGKGKRGIPISGIQVYDGGIRDVLIRNQ